MLSAIHEMKFDQLFRIYANAEGVITEASYHMYIARIRRELGWSKKDKSYLAVRQQLLEQWQMLLCYADTKQDGVIDREEHHAFVGAMVRQAIATGDYTDLDTTARQWFTLLDRDGDGKVGREEYQCFLNMDGYSEVDAEDVVAYLDRDGDGLLTEQEIVEAHREFFIATDPLARGNYLFGQTVLESVVLG